MKFFKLKITLLSLTLGISLINTGCSKEPDIIGDYSEVNMIGSWLLSSARPSDWVTYTFKNANFVESVWFNNNFETRGNGSYFTRNDSQGITGNIEYEDSYTLYIDWIQISSSVFEKKIEIYNNNVSSGEYSLYKILKTISIDKFSSQKINYREYTGTPDNYNFRSVNADIVNVDFKTGELTGVDEGTSFVIFETPGGTAAIQVEVINYSMPLSQYIVGSWASVNEKEWEIDTFDSSSYFSSIFTSAVTDNSVLSSQGKYTVDENKNTVTVNMDLYGTTVTSEFKNIRQQPYSFTADLILNGNTNGGSLLSSRVVGSFNLSPTDQISLEDNINIEDANILSFKSLREAVVSVNDEGIVTANSTGYGFIQISTTQGEAMAVIYVESKVIPIEFQSCLDQSVTALKKILGANPFLETETMLAYENYNEYIDMIICSIDEWTGLCQGLSIIYNDKVNPEAVSHILSSTFFPYKNGNTATTESYINSQSLDTSTVGVTWTVPELTLTYVRLPQPLFKYYGLLLDKNRDQVIKKMGKDPSISSDVGLGYLSPEENVEFLYVAYDGPGNNQLSWGIQVNLNKNLTETQMKTYFNRLYTFLPSQSVTNEYYAYVTSDEKVIILYDWNNSTVQYFLVATNEGYSSRNGHDLSDFIIYKRNLMKSKTAKSL